MNSENDNRLEIEIDRELKRLPDLKAPGTLTLRVMAAIQKQATTAWYRQSWQHWPVPLQIVCVLFFVALVGALCFGLWKLPDTRGFLLVAHKVTGWFSLVSTLWAALNAVVAGVALAIKHLGTGFLLSLFAAGALVWVMCLGLGTVAVRLALSRK
jgi:uncharacterized membrane protein